jgi:hypothetical protein
MRLRRDTKSCRVDRARWVKRPNKAEKADAAKRGSVLAHLREEGRQGVMWSVKRDSRADLLGN